MGRRVDEALHHSGLLADTDVERFRQAGHFVYESGDHGDTWLALDLLFADPRRLRRAAARLAEKLTPHSPELICGPLNGGALVGQWVAYELDVAFVYAAPQPRSDGVTATYAIPSALQPLVPGRRAIVVDDAINAGSAVRACRSEIEKHAGRVVGVASLLARTPSVLDLWIPHVPVEYLVGVPWNIWSPVECPLCRSGVPLHAPGC